MGEIKLIVCDLDGTLLNDRKQISSYTKFILGEVRKKGVKICLASGRDEQMMSIYRHCIGGCDYIISDNGALLRRYDEKILYSEVMEEGDAAAIRSYLEGRGIDFMLYSAQKMFFAQGSDKLRKRITDYEALAKTMGYHIKLKAEELQRTDSSFCCRNAAKIVAYENDKNRMRNYIEFLETLPKVYHEATGYGLEGVFHKKVSKKTALLQIMKDMGIGADGVCVFGDYINDMSMFECAKHRVCMENGVPELKAAATCIAPSNNEDGVAHHLAKVFNLRIE